MTLFRTDVRISECTGPTGWKKTEIVGESKKKITDARPGLIMCLFYI